MIDVFLDSTKQVGLVELDGAKLTAKLTGGTTLGSIKANIGVIGTGKYYWEVKVNAVTSTALCIGVCSISDLNTSSPPINSRTYLGSGNKNPTNIAYGAGYTTNDVISVLLDLDSGTLGFWKNGVNQGVSHTDISSLGQVSPYFIIWYTNASHNSSFTTNFGATPFQYTIPQGYKAYNNPSADKILLLSVNEKINVINQRAIIHETKMTTNILPSPLKASASSETSTNFSPWKAFNGTVDASNDVWRTLNTKNGWIQLDFGTPKMVDAFTIKTRDNDAVITASPKNFNLEGSHNGVDFFVVKEFENEINWMKKEQRKYKLEKTVSYQFYKLNIFDNNGATVLEISELEFSYSESNIANIPSQSEQSFINHGMSQSDLASIDMSADFTEKHYIQDAPIVIGSGKVFEQALDVNKSIKKIKIK